MPDFRRFVSRLRNALTKNSQAAPLPTLSPPHSLAHKAQPNETGGNAVKQAGFIIPKTGLDTLGLKNLGTVHWNLSVPALYEEAIRRREGQVGLGAWLLVGTGVHPGRSPNDKFFVEDSGSKGRIDWGKTNKPISP